MSTRTGVGNVTFRFAAPMPKIEIAWSLAT